MRPLPETGLSLLGLWIENKQWQNLEEAHDVDEEVNIFNVELMKQVNIFLPEKNIKIHK